MMECVAPFVNDLLRVDSVRTRARIFVTTSPAVRFHAIALEAGGGGWRGNPRLARGKIRDLMVRDFHWVYGTGILRYG
mgnify:CR=1 FL=1